MDLYTFFVEGVLLVSLILKYILSYTGKINETEISSHDLKIIENDLHFKSQNANT